MLDVPYLAQLIRVVLSGVPMPHSERAIPLLLGIAAQESSLKYTRQLGSGPARGYWQMEPATERSHWQWLARHKSLEQALIERCGIYEASSQALQHNIPYQILMARVHFYRRDPEPLPFPEAIAEQAARWKQFYNTVQGHGTIEQYMRSWETLIAPFWSPP